MMETEQPAMETIFSNLFSSKHHLLEMYRAVHPEDTEVTEDDIADISRIPLVPGGLDMSVGFSVRDSAFVFVSSPQIDDVLLSVMLMIQMVGVMDRYLVTTGQDLNSPEPVHLPMPELSVIYTGRADSETAHDVSLRRGFREQAEKEGEPDDDLGMVGVKGDVISEKNARGIILEYIQFCWVLDEKIEEHGYSRMAIQATIETCRERDVLKEYLDHNESAVRSILAAIFLRAGRGHVADEQNEDSGQKS